MSELSRKQCFKTYMEYKRACDIVYSDMKCDIKGIEEMSREELNEYVRKIQKLYIKSGVCVRLRKIYREMCVSEEKRDKGHEYAIDKANKYTTMCERVIEKIGERYEKLKEKEEAKKELREKEKKNESEMVERIVLPKKKAEKKKNEKVTEVIKKEEEVDFKAEMEVVKQEYKQYEEEVEKIYDEFLEKLGEVGFDDIYLYNLFIFYINNKWKKVKKESEFINFESKEDMKIVKKIVKEPLDKTLVKMIVANFEIECIKTDEEAREMIRDTLMETPYKEYIEEEKIDKKRMEDIIKEVVAISTVFLIKDSEYRGYLMEYMNSKELITYFIPKIIIHKALYAVIKRRYAKSPYWFNIEKNKMENIEKNDEIKEETIRSEFMKYVNRMRKPDWVSSEKLMNYMILYTLEDDYKTNFLTESVRNRFIKDKRERKIGDLSKWERNKLYTTIREGEGWMIGFIAKYVK